MEGQELLGGIRISAVKHHGKDDLSFASTFPPEGLLPFLSLGYTFFISFGPLRKGYHLVSPFLATPLKIELRFP